MADARWGKVVYPFSRRKEIIALLEEHITENIVKVVCTCHCASP